MIRAGKTYHELLSLLETPKERRQSTNVHGVGQDRHAVVQDSSKLAEQGSNPLATLRNLNVEELLHGKSEALFVGHHGDVVETVEVREGLKVGLVLDQLLGTTVQKTDVGIGSNDFLAIELQNQTQHTVGGGMLRTKVDGVVSNLSVVYRVVARLLGGTGQLAAQAVGVPRIGEVVVDGDELGAHGLGSRIFASDGGREGTGGGQRCRPQTQTLGSSASESVKRSHCVMKESGEVAWSRRRRRNCPLRASCSESIADCQRLAPGRQTDGEVRDCAHHPSTRGELVISNETGSSGKGVRGQTFSRKAANQTWRISLHLQLHYQRVRTSCCNVGT